MFSANCSGLVLVLIDLRMVRGGYGSFVDMRVQLICFTPGGLI